MSIGKAYAHTLASGKKPDGDFYPTPRSLVWCAENVIKNNFQLSDVILDPCFGNGAISDELKRIGYSVKETDIKIGVDYLISEFKEKNVITNPPFSLWDEFVDKAKSHCEKIMMIGRLNYFGTESRLRNGMWKNLKEVHCFNRYVDYRTPERNDGMFHVGAMATAWFLWDMNWSVENPTLHFIDVNGYAKLGNLKTE